MSTATLKKVFGFKINEPLVTFVSCFTKKLNTEEKWIQHDFAETLDGDSVMPKDPGAARFCLLGARETCTAEDSREGKFFIAAFTAFARENNIKNRIAGWNDDEATTYADIRKFLKYLKGLVK